MKNYDCLFKRELNEFSLELSLNAEQMYGCGGWFREFSDFYETYMGYGEL